MNSFNGRKETYQVNLLPDLHNKIWLNRLSCVGQNSGNAYVISQQKNTREWSCSCKAWIFSLKRKGFRDCDHLFATGLLKVQDGENAPVSIINIIGPTRYYAQMAQRHGTITIAK